MAKTYPFKPDWTVAPGELLRERLLESGHTINACAKAMGVSHRRVSRLLAGKALLTADLAVALEFLGPNAEYWMKLETTHRLFLARKKAKKR